MPRQRPVREPGDAGQMGERFGEPLHSDNSTTCFCHVTGSRLPLEVLAGPLGLDVIDSDDLLLLEWARAERERRTNARRARILAEEIGI